MPAANAYEKSYLYSMAANAAADQDDQAKAAEYFRKAVETDGLENDGHFGAMYNLGVIQFGLEKYQDSLTTMERFLAETRSTKSEHRGFRAGILANLDRHDEAAKIYRELVAENPADKRLLMNAVAALQGADKFDQANLLLEDAHKRGMLTESRELRALYVGYMNAERWTDAQKVIDEGLARNVLQAGPDLARDYQVLAQNAYVDDSEVEPELHSLDDSVERGQCERLRAWRESRDQNACDDALTGVLTTARSETNMLPSMRTALATGCTVGEICELLRTEWGTFD